MERTENPDNKKRKNKLPNNQQPKNKKELPNNKKPKKRDNQEEEDQEKVNDKCISYLTLKYLFFKSFHILNECNKLTYY